MILFSPKRVDWKDGVTPIVSDAEIDHYAEAVLHDYKPELLIKPGTIRFEHFLESYLGANLEYHDIYNKDPARHIFGATIFQEADVQVFDREQGRISVRRVPSNTIILDNYVMKPGKEGLALFTGIHEAGHFLMHRDVYTQGSFKHSTQESDSDAVYKCCRQEDIESYGVRKRYTTASQWYEHHANYFAAALTMPLKTFKPYVWQILNEQGVRKKPLVIGQGYDTDYIAKDLIPEFLSEVYGVSKRAAFIRLRKCGFVTGLP